MGKVTETQVAVAIVTMVMVKVGGETQTLMHGRREAKLI